jgi:type II secretory pathway pseudopilin PulG
MKLMTVDRNRKPKRSLVSKLLREQKGQLLIEVLVAVAILGVVSVTFLSAVVTSYGAVALADRKTTAESLTRTEIERVRNATYPITDYTRTSTSPAPPSPPPSGWVVLVHADPINPTTTDNATTYVVTGTPNGMQMITVTVSRDGKVVSTTKTNKVNR